MIKYVKRPLQTIKNNIALIGLVMTILAFLFGQSILLKPKINISCGAIDLKTPTKLKMELFYFKMLMQKDQIRLQVREETIKHLMDNGIDSKKAILLADWMDGTETKGIYDSAEEIPFEPYEQNIINYVISKVSSSIATSFQDELLLPETVFFFEIANDGNKDAKNAHIVVRFSGTIYQDEIYSDNKIINKKVEGNVLTLDMTSISPDSTTKGIIWYSRTPAIDGSDFGKNEITITYENGTIKKKFKENYFIFDD